MGVYTGTRALDAKRGGARLALMLAVMAALVALALTPTLARADDVVDNDEVVNAVPLTGSATVKDLPDGQIQITVSSTNDSGADVPGHLVEFEAPDGYELVSGSLKSAVQTTKDGDTLSTTAVFKKTGESTKKDTGNKVNTGKKGALPRTGDTLTYIGVAVVCLCAGVLFIMAARKLHFKGMILIVATVALVAASYPVPMLQAFADEATSGNTVAYEVEDDAPVSGEEEDAACDTPVTGTKTLDLTAGDQEVSVDAKVTFLVAGDHDSASTVNVDTSNSIAKYATSAFLILESPEPFAKESTSKKEGEEAIDELSDDEVEDEAMVSDFGFFDGSKLEFSGALEGATLRGDPIVFKTTEKDEYAKNTLDDDDTTHYEMWLAIDDIPAKYAETDADKNYADCMNNNPYYGYISFAEGSFDKGDSADESSLGIACVKFVDNDPTILQVTSKTDALGSDTDVYTYDNGEFYDGSNKFKVAIDLDGVYLGMPVRDDVEGFDQIGTKAYTIDGVEGHTFKQIDADYALANGYVSLLHKDGGPNVTPTALDWDDANLWVEFTVEGATGQEAYAAFTEALSRGVRINPMLASMVGTSYAVIAYPEDTDGSTSDEGDGFAYAESNPTAVMWATDYETSGETTEITYLAAVQGASDLVSDDETVTDVNLKKKTTFTATKQEVEDSGSSDEASNGATNANDASGDADLSSTSGMEVESVGVNDADNNVMELKVTVPTSEFTASLEALGLSTKSDESEVLGSLYSYVSGLDVRMSDGSANAFGVVDTDKQVQLIDGASLMSDLASADTATASSSNSTTATPKSAVKVKESVEKIADDVKRVVNDETVQKAVKTAIESGKEIFGAITKIIKAYKDSGGLGLSMLGPVGSIIGAAVTFINVFDHDETETTYSINDVMNKLDKLEQTVNGISANTSVIALSLQEMENSSDYREFASKLNNLHTYMSGKQMTSLISNLQDKLGKIDTKDGSGKCSLATPLEDMPEDAITLVRTFVTYGNKYARLQAGKSSAEEALNELYTMIVGSTAYHDIKLTDAYFKYTENFYNWESETYTARQAFIATISQMWLNAYMVANADFALQAYDNKTASEYEQAAIKTDADVMQENTQTVMSNLYGDYDWDTITKEYPNLDKDSEKEQTDSDSTQTDFTPTPLDYDLSQIEVGDYYKEYDAKVAEYQKAGSTKADAESQAIQYILDTYYFTESPGGKDAAIKKTHSDGSGVERLLVVDSTTRADHIYFSPTYTDSKGNTQTYYAKTAAYDKTCFAESYIKGDSDGSSGIIDLAGNSTWSANSSFKAWQITQMVKRLKALPTSLRPTITDTDENGNEVQRAVENVDEELQALGFKSINTSPEKNYMLKVAGMDRTTKGKYTFLQAYRNYGMVDKGTTDNPTATADEVLLDDSADENQTWPYILTNIGFDSTLLANGNNGLMRSSYWVELGGSSDRMLGGDIGDRIQHSNDWVITESADVVKGARDCNSNWHSKSRYGTVVNYKDGTVKENQFLYTVDAEYYNSLTQWYKATNWFTNWCRRLTCHHWVTRVEFYAFGVFNLTTKSATIETGAGTGSTDGNLYRRREYIQEAYDNGSLAIELYSPMRFARFEFENSYWWIGYDGKLYPVEEGVKNETSKEYPWYHYEYAK